MSFIFYYPEIDRQNGRFDLRVDYRVDPYVDPDGEVFDDTWWTFEVVYDSGETTFEGGSEDGPFATEFLELGFADTGLVVGYTPTFRAYNEDSGETVEQVLRVLDATSVLTSVELAGAALNDFLLGGFGDDAAFGREGSDYLDGGDGADALKGGAGDDTLVGGAGADVLTGGGGSDDYWIDSLSDFAIEVGGGDAGVDRVFSSVDWTLGDGFEMLYLSGAAARGVGNDLDNTIVGTSNADRIVGGGGDDSLHGDAASDVLVGGDGDDLLDGGSINDRMIGGAGDDIYIVDYLGRLLDPDDDDTVVERAGEGVDTVLLKVGIRDYTLGRNVENLDAGYQVRPFEGTGNGLNNVLTGSNWTDKLYGLGGDDILAGGYGDDRLAGGAGSDTFWIDIGAGRDRIEDFQLRGGDVVRITVGEDFDTFEEVAAAARAFGPDGQSTLITLSEGASIVLAGVAVESLRADDFIFG